MLVALLGLAALWAPLGRAEAALSVPTIAVSPTTLTPYISGGCFATAPCYKITGHADRAVKVTVVVTDAFGKSVSASTFSAETDDPGIGIHAGDYSLAPSVTGLGTHDANPSVLSFVAYAEDQLGNKSAVSAPVSATKIAVAPGDTTPPTLTISGSNYPGMVCGTGYCSFSFCLVFTVLGAYPGQSPAGGCTGRYKMAGSADDSGVGSEIADVVLTVKDSTGAVVTTVHAIGTRRGWQGFWAADILASDYAEGKSYSWSLVAIDAAGNTSAAKTGTFTRYPL